MALKIPQPHRDSLSLYSNNCLKCSHLVEGQARAYVKCHHTKGNTECPAAEVRIVIAGKAVVYARQVLKARDKRDIESEIRLMQYVKSQSEGFRAKFYSELENPT